MDYVHVGLLIYEIRLKTNNHAWGQPNYQIWGQF